MRPPRRHSPPLQLLEKSAPAQPPNSWRRGMRLGRLIGWLVAVLAVIGATRVEAQEAVPHVTHGSLLVKTPLAGPAGEVPAVRTDVRMRLTGPIARVEVTQEFHNPSTEWLEGVYVLPLPEGAAVDAMHLQVGDRVIEGQVREREEARQTYQQAQQAGKKASLLEQERPNIFTISVANVGPGEAVVVNLEYQEVVRYDQGTFRLRFPMVVGPRYIPGAEAAVGIAGTGWGANTTAVPDAERITPPVRHPSEGPINPVSLTIELDAGFPLRRLECPYHAIVTTPGSGTRQSIRLADEAVPADRDFELVWAPDPGAQPAAAVFTEWHDGEPYALVMLVPPATGAGERLPREVVYVIDTSGSMGGASIQQARLALDQALTALTPADRFNVIQFNSTTEQLFPARVPAGPAEVALARHWVQGLQAYGGTEMLPALRAALADGGETPGIRQVVFVTDGLVGNEEQLFTY